MQVFVFLSPYSIFSYFNGHKVVLLFLSLLFVCRECLSVLSVPCVLWSPAGKSNLGPLVCGGFLCFCLFPIWCPGSIVAFDCIDS